MNTETTSAMVKLGVLILVVGWGAFVQWDAVEKTYEYFWIIGAVITVVGLVLDFAYFQGKKDGLTEEKEES